LPNRRFLYRFVAAHTTSTTRGADVNQSLSSPILWPTLRRCSLLDRPRLYINDAEDPIHVGAGKALRTDPSHHAVGVSLALVTSSDVRLNNREAAYYTRGGTKQLIAGSVPKRVIGAFPFGFPPAPKGSSTCSEGLVWVLQSG
jgi:hypothetical protein